MKDGAAETPVRHIAMWSGPRNISTAMMRSWGSRPDCVVCDEPLYAHYLVSSQDKRHPGYAEIITRHDSDWRRVAEWLTGGLADGKRVFYQKHMANHLTPDIGRGWIDSLSNCLLIRDPAEVLASFSEFIPDPVPEDIGLPQQAELFERIADNEGSPPVVLDSRDLLLDPPGMLKKLCDRVGVAFDPAMLRWEPGLRETDGVWAKHWYDNVAQSTGFAEYRTRPKAVNLPQRLRDVHDRCRPLYDRLHAHRLT